MVLRLPNIPRLLSSLMNQCTDKANDSDGIDRISDLPNDIILFILSSLSSRDVVRTSVLSRKWRYIWVLVPWLEFKEDFFGKCKYLGHGDAEIPGIISQVIMLHTGPINSFTLMIPSDYTFRIRCLSNWIMFLSRSGLQHFKLLNRQREPYQMPSNFFSLQTLTFCELLNLELSLSPTFNGFNNLNQIRLTCVKLDSDALDTLISRSPVLATVLLRSCYGLEYINISSASLTYLNIEHCENIQSIWFQNAKNLNYLSIVVLEHHWKSLEKRSISNFVEGLLNINTIFLGDGYIKILSAGIIPKALHRSIDTLKYLHLYKLDFNESRELLFTICLLRSSPNLLGLYIISDVARLAPEPDHLNELDCKSCCHSQLKTVEITVKTPYKHALCLMRFLLANSSSLEILKFKVDFGQNQLDIPLMLSISQDLLQMERASPRAQVKFIY